MKDKIFLFLFGTIIVTLSMTIFLLNYEPAIFEKSEPVSSTEIVTSTISINNDEKSIVTIDYSLENSSENDSIFKFSSGKQFDYRLLNSIGEIVEDTSDKSYTMALSEKRLKKGEKLDFQISFPNLKEGEYLFEVWLTPQEGSKYKETIEFEVAQE